METYINNCDKYKKNIIYDFRLGSGGIGDYIKFFMIILTECMNNNIRIYMKVNNIVIQKYIRLRYSKLYITDKEIIKLKNYSIRRPQQYYKNAHYNYLVKISDVFYFTEDITNNIKNILCNPVKNYISIHLRLGDKYLETDKHYIQCKNDTRYFSEEKLHEFIEKNDDKNILFFCDNHNYRLKLKKKYNNIILTNSKIGHTSLYNTTDKQILDSITDYYLLTMSDSIYAFSYSGFSITASLFNKISLVKMY